MRSAGQHSFIDGLVMMLRWSSHERAQDRVTKLLNPRAEESDRDAEGLMSRLAEREKGKWDGAICGGL